MRDRAGSNPVLVILFLLIAGSGIYILLPAVDNQCILCIIVNCYLGWIGVNGGQELWKLVQATPVYIALPIGISSPRWDGSTCLISKDAFLKLHLKDLPHAMNW